MEKRVKDRVLLLLAIKPRGKLVDFDHIFEKVSRDCGATKEEITNALKELISEGLAARKNEKYHVTEEGRKIAWNFIRDEEMNRSYRLVMIARYYYDKVADYILPFLVDRPVSVIKVFSDDNDPVHRVKPIFSRYKKFKPKTYNYIGNKEELLRYVNMHAIDFIPYVHKEKQNYPDWLIVDIDAGEDIKNAGEQGFELIKEITKITAEVMEEKFNIKPYIKFSGSRGFQIWATFKTPLGDFEKYRRAVVIIQRAVEENLEEMYEELKDKYGELITKPITTSTVAKKEERAKQILLDWSSLKPEGDVRAPFSIHYKTGLISAPVGLNDLMKFKIEQADFQNVLNNAERLAEEFKLEPSDPIKLREELKKEGLLAFF